MSVLFPCVSCRFSKPLKDGFFYNFAIPNGVEPFFICDECQQSPCSLGSMVPSFSRTNSVRTFILVVGSRADKVDVCSAIYKRLNEEGVEKIVIIDGPYLYDKSTSFLSLPEIAVISTVCPAKGDFPHPTWLVFTPLTHQAVIASYCAYYSIPELRCEDLEGDNCFAIDTTRQKGFYFSYNSIP